MAAAGASLGHGDDVFAAEPGHAGNHPAPRSGRRGLFFQPDASAGGSIGVALLTTLLAQREAFHRAVLTEKLVSNDLLTLERLHLYTQKFVGSGFSLVAARNKALALLDSIVTQQSAVLSITDTFWAVAALVMVCLPLIVLLGRPAQGMKVEMGH